MSIRRFRKTVVPWRTILVTCGFAILIGARWFFPVSRTTIDPTQISVGSGDFLAESITDAARVVCFDTTRERTFRIRLLAIAIADEPLAASTLREQIHNGQTLHVRFDRRRLSEDSKELQAYVFVGDLCLNQELVRLGLATEDTHPSDSGPMIRRIKKAEQEAREQRRGLWSNETK